MKRIAVLIVLCLFMTSCLPVLVGSAIMAGAKNKKSWQEFNSNLQKTNEEREAAGLQPLNWCKEAYQFDRKWAVRDMDCRHRILSYESGQKDAFDPNVTPSWESQPKR